MELFPSVSDWREANRLFPQRRRARRTAAAFVLLLCRLGGERGAIFGHADVARLAGVSLRSVEKATAAMVAAGVLVRERRHDPVAGYARVSRWRLVFAVEGQE